MCYFLYNDSARKERKLITLVYWLYKYLRVILELISDCCLLPHGNPLVFSCTFESYFSGLRKHVFILTTSDLVVN